MGAGAHGARRARCPAAAVVGAHTARRHRGLAARGGGRRRPTSAARARRHRRRRRGRGGRRGEPPRVGLPRALAALGLVGAYAAVVGRAHADAARDPSPGAHAARRRRRDPRPDAARGRPARRRRRARAGRAASRRCGRSPARWPRRRAVDVSLRYGYVTNGLTDHRLEDALGLLADCGYDGVALTLDHVHFDPFAPRAARRAPRGCGRARRSSGSRASSRPARASCSTRAASTSRRCSATAASGGVRPAPPRGRRRRRARGARRLDLVRRAAAGDVDPERGLGPAGSTAASACSRTRSARGVALGFEPEPGMLVERLGGLRATRRAARRTRAALGLTLDIGHCVCLEPEPVADCVAPRRADAGARPRRGHAPRRARAPDVRRGRARPRRPRSRALAEVGYDGLVAVELSRHSHAAHETVPRGDRALCAASARSA